MQINNKLLYQRIKTDECYHICISYVWNRMFFFGFFLLFDVRRASSDWYSEASGGCCSSNIFGLKAPHQASSSYINGSFSQTFSTTERRRYCSLLFMSPDLLNPLKIIFKNRKCQRYFKKYIEENQIFKEQNSLQ